MSDAVAKPIVKWAGGKRQLLAELRKHVPERIGRYFEPFVGGGALLFDLLANGHKVATIADTNPCLCWIYQAVRDDVEKVIEELTMHEARHSEENYKLARSVLWTYEGGPKLAALAIYLNKTCFNGLWRTNRDGQFNVPLDKSTLDGSKRTICDAANLRACSRVLQGVEVLHQGFEQTMALADPGDFVYCDPPYVPVNAVANFTSYTKDGFTMEDQRRLRDAAVALKQRGARVLLSNADLPVVRDLYAGFQIYEVSARRNINSKASARGAVGEVLIA